MILAPGAVMVYSPWCIKLAGMDNFGRKRSDERKGRYQFGRWTGNLMYLVMIFAVADILFDIINNVLPVPTLPNLFIVALPVIIAFSIIDYLLSYVSVFYIIRYLFHSANQSIAYLISIVFNLLFVVYEWHIIYASFNGFRFIVTAFFFGISALFELILIGASMIEEYRCPNCHSFNSKQTGLTDLGITEESHQHWEDTNDIDPTSADAHVKNGRKLVNTVDTVHRWKTHHQCDNCKETWEVHDRKTLKSSDYVLKKTWTEEYRN